MGLTVKDDEPDGGGVGGLAWFIAFCAAGVGAVRWWQDLGPTWGWVALMIGAFAVGMALFRLVIGHLRDFGDIMSALGALGLAGSAIAGVVAPIAPVIGVGVVLLPLLASIFLFEA
jgi:hypothetical protein